MKLKRVPSNLNKAWGSDVVLEERAIKKDHTLKGKPPSTDYGFPTDFIDFNRMIGNPTSKITNIQQDMTKFQLHYHNAIQTWHTVEFNKSRKLGATESFIRSAALNCFDRYEGHDVMIIAGNEVRIANEILLRFDELFRDKYHDDGLYAFKSIDPKYEERGLTLNEAQDEGDPYKHDELIRRANFGSNPTVEFHNGTRVMAFAASRQEKAQSFRGTDDVICAFVSEAAHTGMKNDQPIMTALEPNLAQRDDADLILESTPNGRRGMFFFYWINTMEVISNKLKIPVTDHQGIVDEINRMWLAGDKIDFPVDWWPLRYDYQVGIDNNILSKKFIEKEKRNPKLDFEQEYMCKFSSTYSQAIKTEDLTFKDTLSSDYVKSIDLLGPQGIDRDYGTVNY